MRYTTRFSSALITAAFILSPLAPVVAEEEDSERPARAVDLPCVQQAVDAREDAIIAAESALHTAWAAALQARKTALHAAWGMTDKAARKAAIKDAWKAFKSAKKSARQTHKKAVNEAWKTFKKNRKMCGGSKGEGEESGRVDNM